MKNNFKRLKGDNSSRIEFSDNQQNRGLKRVAEKIEGDLKGGKSFKSQDLSDTTRVIMEINEQVDMVDAGTFLIIKKTQFYAILVQTALLAMAILFILWKII